MRVGKKMEKMITECHVVHDGNVEDIFSGIPPLIEEAGGPCVCQPTANLIEIYLDACIYIGHYTRPYHTLKSFDDLTTELNDEMYTGKYFAMDAEKYHAVHTLGKAQQFYGRALTELLEAAQENDGSERVEAGCRHFECSLDFLKQLAHEYFSGREHQIVDFYFTFLTLLGSLGEREKLLKYYKDIFTWEQDLSTDACQFLFYQMEIIILTLDGHYESALAIYRQIFEARTEYHILSIGKFIKLCYKHLGRTEEYGRFLKNAYKWELEQFEKLDPPVMGSLLKHRKELKLDIYIDSFTQVFNIVGGKPAVYKFN